MPDYPGLRKLKALKEEKEARGRALEQIIDKSGNASGPEKEYWRLELYAANSANADAIVSYRSALTHNAKNYISQHPRSLFPDVMNEIDTSVEVSEKEVQSRSGKYVKNAESRVEVLQRAHEGERAGTIVRTHGRKQENGRDHRNDPDKRGGNGKPKGRRGASLEMGDDAVILASADASFDDLRAPGKTPSAKKPTTENSRA